MIVDRFVGWSMAVDRFYLFVDFLPAGYYSLARDLRNAAHAWNAKEFGQGALNHGGKVAAQRRWEAFSWIRSRYQQHDPFYSWDRMRQGQCPTNWCALFCQQMKEVIRERQKGKGFDNVCTVLVFRAWNHCTVCPTHDSRFAPPMVHSLRDP